MRAFSLSPKKKLCPNGVTVSEVVGEILENTPGILRFDSLEQENCPPLLYNREKVS